MSENFNFVFCHKYQEGKKGLVEQKLNYFVATDYVTIFNDAKPG